jgi:putative ABC transport system permease protein
MTLLVRTSGDPRALINAVRTHIQSLDRRMPVFAVKTLPEHMTWALWAPRMAASLSLAFGLVALLLSAVGLYSVMAYVVSQRTREVGIRMALGAQPRDVLRLMAAYGMNLAFIGLAIGLGLAFVLARALSAVLIGISVYDLTIFLAVPVLLTVVAAAACVFPARRATKVDPLVALRYE